MSKAEAVMLAHVYKNQSLAGCLLSEKIDGVRAIWDGGISRGIPCSQVPYANVEKDYKKVSPPVATGLWSRTFKPIHAPAWFLDLLPGFPLDGELHAGRGNWQQTQHIVSQDNPTDEWRLVEYKIIDSPSWNRLFAMREVKVRNDYSFVIAGSDWAYSRAKDSGVPDHWTIEFVNKWLANRFPVDGQISRIDQIELPFKPLAALKMAMDFASRVVAAGGEGAIARKRNSIWVPQRSWDLLKIKPELDAEGVVTGYWTGKETNKGSKLLGMMGALELEWQGDVFKISGFTDAERRFASPLSEDWARENPGKRLPSGYTGIPEFPIGALVTFKYRELTDDGVPKEARYMRPA